MLKKAFPDFYTKLSSTQQAKTPKLEAYSKYKIWWLSIPLVLVVIVISFTLASAFLRCYLNRRFQNADISTFFMGKSPSNNEQSDGLELAESLKYQKEKLEIPRSSFQIG